MVWFSPTSPVSEKTSFNLSELRKLGETREVPLGGSRANLGDSNSNRCEHLLSALAVCGTLYRLLLTEEHNGLTAASETAEVAYKAALLYPSACEHPGREACPRTVN